MNKSIERSNNFEKIKVNPKINTKISSIKDHISHMQDSGIFINN